MSLFKYFRPTYNQHSSGNAYLCAILSYYVYNPIHDISVFDESRMNRITRWWRSVSPHTPRNNTHIRFYSDSSVDAECYVFSNPEMCFIAFRGTEGVPFMSDDFKSSWNDWLNNLQVWQENGIHNGFTTAVNALYSDIVGRVRSLQDAYPNIEICLTGHSMGGALASICSRELFNRDGIRCSCVYTYSAPRFASPDIATSYSTIPSSLSGLTLADRTWRWVLQSDPTPWAPPAEIPPFVGLIKYQHVGNLRWINNNGQVTRLASSNQDFGGSAEFDDHSMARMCRWMNKFVDSGTRENENSPAWLLQSDVRAMRGLW